MNTDEPETKLTEVRYEHSPGFASLLQHAGGALMIATYQAHRLVVVGVKDGALSIVFHHFEQVMGIAAGVSRLAIGTRRQVWLLRRARELAASLPGGPYDDCYLTRHAHQTGRIHIHELAWGKDELWLVNTLFSCLCTLDGESHFIPRWKPPFISKLAGEDRCHLNGMAMKDGVAKYVTVLARTDEPAGWRPNKATTGCVLHVPSGEPVTTGLSMPHSPRYSGDKLWVLNSGHGALTHLDELTGRPEPVAYLPGYTRGLAFAGHLAFVGLSKIRESNVFGGLPIAERRKELKCGVGVIDVRTGALVGQLEFVSGVEEIADVQILFGSINPFFEGPDPETDSRQPVWVAAQPRWIAGTPAV